MYGLADHTNQLLIAACVQVHTQLLCQSAQSTHVLSMLYTYTLQFAGCVHAAWLHTARLCASRRCCCVRTAGMPILCRAIGGVAGVWVDVFAEG